MFWEKDSIEYEIFNQYEYALSALGVDFEREDVQAALEGCSCELEDILKSVISYWVWLQEQEKIMEYPSAVLIRALYEKWKPKNWRDEWLELPQLQSPGKKWYDGAAKIWGYDLRNQLVANIARERRREYIEFSNGKQLLVETAWRWGWERVLNYVTT
jgi:hypothetical protein